MARVRRGRLGKGDLADPKPGQARNAGERGEGAVQPEPPPSPLEGGKAVGRRPETGDERTKTEASDLQPTASGLQPEISVTEAERKHMAARRGEMKRLLAAPTTSFIAEELLDVEFNIRRAWAIAERKKKAGAPLDEVIKLERARLDLLKDYRNMARDLQISAAALEGGTVLRCLSDLDRVDEDAAFDLEAERTATVDFDLLFSAEFFEKDEADYLKKRIKDLSDLLEDALSRTVMSELLRTEISIRRRRSEIAELRDEAERIDATAELTGLRSEYAQHMEQLEILPRQKKQDITVAIVEIADAYKETLAGWRERLPQLRADEKRLHEIKVAEGDWFMEIGEFETKEPRVLK